MITLWVLTGLFAGRVAGQLIVLAWAPSYLPPFDEWSSGLIPYPLLVPLQLLILTLQVRICRDVRRGSGRFVPLSARAARRVRVSAWIYAGAMLARYVITMALAPEQRWLGGTIPIWFHLVLASFLGVYANLGNARRAGVEQARERRGELAGS